MNHWQSFLIALQFLTTIPIRINEPIDPKNIGMSLIYYPIIGLIIGLLILSSIGLLSGQSIWVITVLSLALWIILTGGLHLDGLADSADAWLGGLNDKETTLRIMKDPASGPVAVVILLLVILIKFVMLAELIQQQAWYSILAVVILPRTALPLLFLTTPYVRPNGIGAILVKQLPHKPVHIMLIIISLLALITLSWLHLIIILTVFLVLRYAMLQRLNGTTGDTAGAVVELLETTALITAVTL